ncbi:hypothetical protein COCMIDRAFT_90531 [Bipolaris oryzae ATCC 44560]|uniref:Uncharacterized protein n=1 Tax=Bipolaris oryzae ATCC 44560 TaxID=930090 RepID=W6ZBS9_COCMI|nr:uncharacterized protein COCMIDRAFT_90531 [Bipolaris oryzae ATCC 44560]EUC47268.1 hypothetical protein COCMIDRAFT_90531 [Bipolaris oryzae ATCC 44560]
MYSPRSFPYLQHSPPSPRSSRSKSERMGTRLRSSPSPQNTRPVVADTPTQSTTIKHMVRPEQKPQSPPASDRVPPTTTTTTTTPTMSKPVGIPPRTPLKSSSSTQTSRMRTQQRHLSARTIHSHDAKALPPAVAALLAVTTIPKMPARRRQRSAMDRRISMDELIQEWRQEDSDTPSSLSGSPMDLLLGRVDESDDEYSSGMSMEQEKASFLTSRSISSDSISLPPSLDYENPSYASHWDNISTPDSIGRKSLPERKEKIVSSPPKEDCILDHPLLHFGPDDCEDIIVTNINDTAPPAPPTERFRSFKSNLTASLQALKLAAKSFSNFTAPSVPPDDFLTRSLLSPNFTSEMRPKMVDGLPSPELRRYLNPQPAPISATELSMHLHDSFTLDTDLDPHAPMIQLQTYERRGRAQKSRRSRAADPLSEAGRVLSNDAPTVRQREPRENSDFLRVIVLEMNMRRVGKLDAKAVGKARIWLPPRKPAPTQPPSRHGPNRVPLRWIPINSS